MNNIDRFPFYLQNTLQERRTLYLTKVFDSYCSNYILVNIKELVVKTKLHT